MIKQIVAVAAVLFAVAGSAKAQEPAARGTVPVPSTRATFKDAIDRALAANPSVQQAAAEIDRSRALLARARADILPGANASVVSTTLNEGRSFNGAVTTPRSQVATSLAVSAPLFAPVQWAERTQARDVVQVSEVNAADVRRQVAVATAQAYLAVIARRRVLEADVRARDTARAHYDLARQQRMAGSGSLLNELRAEQSVAFDEVRVEQASLDLYRAQEALGVLLAADGPVDTVDEPALDTPQSLEAAESAMPSVRTDVRLAAARQSAAARVLRDSWKDWLPAATGLFQPQYVEPQSIFQPSGSWRAQVSLSVPLFDAGLRGALRGQRRALLAESELQHTAVLRQARSDVRAAATAVASADRALADARSSADQARRVVDIVNVSFRAGAATNIEVIDAQRALLDAETAVAVAEDLLRQAKLALNVALGRFP